ncbi:hypothetical protein PpSQ1_14950 [Pseudomonas putida]|nr:hypothetical protein PpSQ1_14950 [Pseudomonas putida]
MNDHTEPDSIQLDLHAQGRSERFIYSRDEVFILIRHLGWPKGQLALLGYILQHLVYEFREGYTETL